MTEPKITYQRAKFTEPAKEILCLFLESQTVVPPALRMSELFAAVEEEGGGVKIKGTHISRVRAFSRKKTDPRLMVVKLKELHNHSLYQIANEFSMDRQLVHYKYRLGIALLYDEFPWAFRYIPKWLRKRKKESARK